MLRSAASTIMWVGRATVFLVGLAVVLALIFGVATTALGADGNPFLLGKRNVASTISTLVKQGTGPALKLQVGAGQPPLAVNSKSRVANLNAATAGRADSAVSADSATNAMNAQNAANADTLDNRDSNSFANASHDHAGGDITSGLVAEAYIDPALERHNEVMNTVKANDGSGSGLDADLLDGKNSTAFVEQGDIMYATVFAAGGVLSSASTPDTTASHSSTGTYTVTFPNITAANCAFTYGLESGSSFGFIRGTIDGNTLKVSTANTSGTLTDLTFNVIARCS